MDNFWSYFFPYISLNLCIAKSVIYTKISNFFNGPIFLTKKESKLSNSIF